jgi:hypothetical protein
MPSSKSSNLQNIEPSGLRQPWDRRKDETQRAFAAFCIFRDSTDRKLANVAKVLTPACSVPNVARWSARHDWQERVLAYDVYRDEIDRQELARGRMEMRRRHLKLGIMMQSIGAHALAELQQKIAQKLPLNLTSDEAKSLLAAGAKLEGDALGPERDGGRYTQIVVSVGEHKYEDEGSVSPAAVIDGEKKLVN